MAETAVVATPETPALAPGEVDTPETRAQELIRQLTEEKDEPDTSEDVDAEGDTEPAPAEDDDGEEKPEPKAAAPVDKAKEERDARLRRAADLEKKARVGSERMIQEKAALAQERSRVAEIVREANARVEATHARMAEAERIIAMLKDPASALELVGKHIPPEQLRDWIIKSQDPTVRAEWAAKKYADEAKSASNPQLEAMAAEMKSLKEERARERYESSRDRQQRGAIDFATANAEHAPYAAALASQKPQRFLAAVHTAVDALRGRREEVTYEAVLLAIDADLADSAQIYAPKTSAGDVAPSETSAPAPASKARSLSSRTTAGRSTLAASDTEVAPLDDRVADLKQRIRRGETIA